MQQKVRPALLHSCDPQDAGSTQQCWRSPIPGLFQHCRYQWQKMVLRGRSVYHNVEAMVKHSAHFARGTSVLESPAAEVFRLSKWALSSHNSETSILINLSVFLLKPCFGASWKSLFSFYFLPTSTLQEINSHLQVKPSEKQIDGWHLPYSGQKFAVV